MAAYFCMSTAADSEAQIKKIADFQLMLVTQSKNKTKQLKKIQKNPGNFSMQSEVISIWDLVN